MVRATPRGKVVIGKILYVPTQVYDLDDKVYEENKGDFRLVEVVENKEKKKILKDVKNKMLKSEKTK